MIKCGHGARGLGLSPAAAALHLTSRSVLALAGIAAGRTGR
jgi:hypothetical protein